MNKMLLVARREYLFNLRRRSFLFAVFGVPIFTFIVWAVIFLVISNNEENLDDLGSVGYVDRAGVLSDPVFPQDDPERVVDYVAYESEDAARSAFDAGSIGAYFVISDTYWQTGEVRIYDDSGVPDALENSITALLLANVSRNFEGDLPLERLHDPVQMTIRVADSGRTLTEANIPALIFMPLIFAFLFLMSSNVTSGFLMSSVVEEKTNRIMEILVTSVTPMQLLLGKILGLGALGLTQLVVWGIAGFMLIRFGQGVPFLAGIEFPTELAVIFLIYFLLSYFLLSSLMAGLGAVVASEEESRQYASILSLIFIIPFFLIAMLIEDPNSPMAVALTLIPFTAPMTVLLRLGFGNVPTWQLIASMGILLLTGLLVVLAAARIFRWALLLYGKRPSPRELWRVIRQAPQAATVEAHATQEVAS